MVAAMAESWRLFVAIKPGTEVREVIRAAQEVCRRGQFPLRLIDPAGAHLTLKFLGATDPGRVALLGVALRAAAARQRPFMLQTADSGAFPTVARARVLWLGLAGELDALGALQQAVDAALADCGVPRETRPFRPHFTLGRVRAGAAPVPAARIAALLAALPQHGALLPVTALHLFRSTAGPDGRRYATLLDAPLRGVSCAGESPEAAGC